MKSHEERFLAKKNEPQPQGWTDVTRVTDLIENPDHVREITTHIYRLSSRLAEVQLNRERLGKTLEQDMARNGAAKQGKIIDIMTDNLNLVTDDLRFSEDYRTARRISLYLQALAMTEPGGALNFVEQMRPVQLRFLRDLADAYARLFQAHDGMQAVYGYSYPLPDPKDSHGWDHSFLDACLAWSRNAVAFITRFAQRDQVVSIPFSIRRSISQDGWRLTLGDSNTIIDKQILFQFKFPAEMLEEAYYPRIWGVTLYTVPKIGREPKGVFQARVLPPAPA